MENNTILYVKLDTDKEVRIAMTHVTAAMPTPHESDQERGLTVRELIHVNKRLAQGDYTKESNF